jgi:hypothetical protein
MPPSGTSPREEARAKLAPGEEHWLVGGSLGGWVANRDPSSQLGATA